ncbi:MAG: N-acetylmuramoyl-L-alanine amidase [Lachnospiraceae bacterium]|nr:N-acetylmuramoyl-L-alanine amidase [Lachnospiraceae bacterium]
MGQAQRRDTRSTVQSSGRRASQGHRGNSAGNTGATARKTKERDIELWEINREEQPRMMRLAEREERQPERKARNLQPVQSARRTSGNPRPVHYSKRNRARRRKVYIYRLIALFVIVVCLVLIYQTTGAIYRMAHRDKVKRKLGIVDVISEQINKKEITPPEIVEDFLEVNDYSRPGTKVNRVKNIFVHYTANPGTSAQQNRSYFANLAQTKERSASAHFIIGYEGEILQCIPLEEQAYGVKTRNDDSISIECCYLNENGEFTQETYDTLIHTLAWLIQEYDLTTEDILRHYDCGGKKCPLYYVENPNAWEKLLADVERYQQEGTDS